MTDPIGLPSTNIANDLFSLSADAIYRFYDAVNLIDNIRAIEEKKGKLSNVLITQQAISSLVSLINEVLNDPDSTESVEELKKALTNLFEANIVKPS